MRHREFRGAAPTAIAHPGEFRITSEFDINRLVSLSDGVFAIAMTLLVLEIRLPALPPNPGDVEYTRTWVAPVIFLASIGLALYQPYWTQYTWILVGFNRQIVRAILGAPSDEA